MWGGGILKNNRYRSLKRWMFEVVMAKGKLLEFT